MLQLDPAGKVRVLFPVAPMDNPVVQANRRYELRQPGEGSSFVATDGGVGLVFAALGVDPFRFDGLVTPEGDWSSAAFQIDRQSQNPEAALVNLVQAIVSDRGFDYDLLDYQVAGRVAEEVEVPAWCGTDGAASNNRLDLYAEMRLASLIAKVATGDAAAFPAADALRMATIGGARALSARRSHGSIVAGKEADLIAVDMGELADAPVYDPISHLVHVTSRERVTDVWICGERIVC